MTGPTRYVRKRRVHASLRYRGQQGHGERPPRGAQVLRARSVRGRRRARRSSAYGSGEDMHREMHSVCVGGVRSGDVCLRVCRLLVVQGRLEHPADFAITETRRNFQEISTPRTALGASRTSPDGSKRPQQQNILDMQINAQPLRHSPSAASPIRASPSTQLKATKQLSSTNHLESNRKPNPGGVP